MDPGRLVVDVMDAGVFKLELELTPVLCRTFFGTFG
jgi:hypothetical protein